MIVTEVMTFYRFAPLTDLDGLRSRIEAEALAHGLKGTILLAEEGINGTVSGTKAACAALAGFLSDCDGFADMPFKYSGAEAGNPVFYRLKVKVKAEIVALGRPQLRPAERTGTHVDAETWNKLLDDPDLLVIDTRNQYEIDIGTFPGASDPGTRSFKQFPDYVADLDPSEHSRVAMFCTGGIRCEKASAFMLSRGFDTVYQLDGGILKYLETVEPAENRWQGECFVFDQRVSVDSDLEEGRFEQCFACRHPLDAADLESEDYQQGVSCPYCVDGLDPERRQSFEERQRQVELAAGRGDLHVGRKMPSRT
jgi:UPF0176 protein